MINQQIITNEQDTLFESIINYSNDAIVSETLDGTIISWNKSAGLLFGYNETEIIGRNMSVVLPDQLANSGHNAQNGLNGQKHIYYEATATRKDGSTINISFTLSPIKNKHGEIIGASRIIHDINSRVWAEKNKAREYEMLEKKVLELTENLEQANKEMESFSYSISHDLRAPLRIINGYSDILEKDHKEALNEEGRRVLKVITNNTRRMNVLIDELLKLAKAGKKELMMQMTDMDELVNDVVREQIAIANKPVTVNKSKLISASCDVLMMRQVWSCIISNAVKFSGNNPDQCIEINSCIKENNLIYSVKDNGAGFDMQYSNKLFSIFQRLHSQSEFEGNGAGLALAQKIITRHKGAVWVKAEVDKGATFYFSLPLIS